MPVAYKLAKKQAKKFTMQDFSDNLEWTFREFDLVPVITRFFWITFTFC